MRQGGRVRSVRRRPSPRRACGSRRGDRATRVLRRRGGWAGGAGPDTFRQAELLAHGIGFEHADPQRIETDRCGAEHHVVRDDRGVDVADLLAVVFADPCLRRVGADDDRHRGAEVARTAGQPLHPFLRAHDNEALRLAVRTRGSHTPRFENEVEFFLFDRLFFVAAAGVPLFGQ